VGGSLPEESGMSMPEYHDDLRVAYITCGTQDEAERIARALVGERLAACVNLLPGMRSWYWWEGRIDEAAEVVLIAKTTVAHIESLVARVNALHSYTTPCVVFLPVVGGNPPFLNWLRAEVDASKLTTAIKPAQPNATRASPPPE
jgi:periplasmic divalent cation tolerance protein